MGALPLPSEIFEEGSRGIPITPVPQAAAPDFLVVPSRTARPALYATRTYRLLDSASVPAPRHIHPLFQEHPLRQ